MAAASSRNVNVCAGIFSVDPFFDTAGSFLESELLRDFDLSVQRSESKTSNGMKEDNNNKNYN